MLKMHPALVACLFVSSVALGTPGVKELTRRQMNQELFNLPYCGATVDMDAGYEDKMDYVRHWTCLGLNAEYRWGCRKWQLQNGYVWYAEAGGDPAPPCHWESRTERCDDATCSLFP